LPLRYPRTRRDEPAIGLCGSDYDTLYPISAVKHVAAHPPAEIGQAGGMKELTKRTTFVRVTQQLNEVFGKS